MSRIRRKQKRIPQTPYSVSTKAEGAFDDDLAITVSDESDPAKQRFVTLGIGTKGKVLAVVYTYRSENVRIIPARPVEPALQAVKLATKLSGTPPSASMSKEKPPSSKTPFVASSAKNWPLSSTRPSNAEPVRLDGSKTAASLTVALTPEQKQEPKP